MQFNIHKEFELNGISFHNEKELVLFSKTISNSIFSFLSDFLNDNDILHLQTSGSTGSPELIEIRKEHMVNSAGATGEFFDLKEGTKALLCMNPEFVAGKMMLLRAMVLGWKLDVVAVSMNPLKGIEKVYDFSAMVPLQVYNSIDELNKIKTLIIGGGIVSDALKNRLQSSSVEAYATYGMTETVTHIALKKLNHFLSDTERIRSVYKILPNISISTDSRDCLVIDALKIATDKVVTNDLVEIISDTEFQWLGRFDNIINSGGIKLIPEQIEEKLAEIISDRFFVSGIKDAVLGEKLVLIIESNQDLRFKIQDLKLKSLSKYEIPKEIYFLEKFIETQTKKVQRKKTLELLF
ncbi:MAG: O-succinylbenzoic acid--CoA ligase [Urechidicola sp.]|jgi:O-succinylbenzoic acid--CoA ligase